MTTARQAIESLTKMYADDLDQPLIITWWDYEFAEFFLQHDTLDEAQKKAIWAQVCDTEWVTDDISEYSYETIAEAVNKAIPEEAK